MKVYEIATSTGASNVVNFVQYNKRKKIVKAEKARNSKFLVIISTKTAQSSRPKNKVKKAAKKAKEKSKTVQEKNKIKAVANTKMLLKSLKQEVESVKVIRNASFITQNLCSIVALEHRLEVIR